MNWGIATHIENKIVLFRDMEMDKAWHGWGATVRILVAINVNEPLKRALNISTTMGDEHTVYFTYKRLPNFCYLYGRLGHIDKYCETRFVEGFLDPGPDMPYGSWLCTPLPVRGRPHYSG
ncbi:hypothetical protein Salat_2115700 [Sesamum alatum]|uniref:Zinc knuckle CX2CX4HX4C domain-containing protein n=1 Tax=Sesamum alatum TaxID=300844 RepID=A0AAE1Y1Q4_9LAMI|nr:hypothetical protein Salat_2115700 [Sesamum alatum]